MKAVGLGSATAPKTRPRGGLPGGETFRRGGSQLALTFDIGNGPRDGFARQCSVRAGWAR
jgi:hypothetical protein